MEREVRKTVSVVFSDVAGSTTLGEQLDPEALRRAMTRYFEAASRVHERHGGVVEKFIGDAVMAVYGIPRAHEDDALRAVRAAWELRAAMAALNRELEGELQVTLPVRSGVSTGLVVAGDERLGHAFVGGDTVNIAARLQQAAPVGEVLLSEATRRLVADATRTERLAPFVPRGRTASVPSYRLLDVDPLAAGRARRLDVPLVGRLAELAAVDAALGRVAAGGPCQLVTLVSDAGVGKSRLLAAFAERVAGRARVLAAKCPAYGGGRGAELVGRLVARAAGAAALPGGPGAAFRAVRALLDGLARSEPVVLVVDDLHWAEPDLLDLLEYVHEFAGRARLLLLVAARPELLERRPGWAARPDGAVVRLDPLPAAETATLAARLGGLDDEAAGEVAAWAEGVPLFVEELLRQHADQGLPPASRPAAGAGADPPLPPAVESLLEAELDRLPPDERVVLELASVAGRRFDWSTVEAVAPDALRPRVGELLLALVRRRLVGAAASDGEDAFAFRHRLLREVAYRAIPRHERALVHVRVAERLAGAAGERAVGEDDRVGNHLEQAYRQLAGLTDDRPVPPAVGGRPPVAAPCR